MHANDPSCNGCGSEVKPDAGIPEHGDPGKNLPALITIWPEARLPPGRIDGMLKAVYDLDRLPKIV
jgi:hypothetical protein